MDRPHRLPDWQLPLMQYIAARARTPVDPTRPVCAEFVAGAVEAMTGQPLAFDWQDRYETVTAGLRALRKAGHADHVAMAASLFEEIPAALACPGDIAVLPGPDGVAALGIVQGAVIYVQSENGIGAVPLTTATAAFRVPTC